MRKIRPRKNWPKDVTYYQSLVTDPDYFAWAEYDDNRIVLNPDWKTSDEDLDLVVWHEYRHILHHREGLFPNYYKDFFEVQQLIIDDPMAWIKFAWEVEQDCDSFAEGVVGAKFYNKYPVKSVLFYEFAMEQIRSRVETRKRKTTRSA